MESFYKLKKTAISSNKLFNIDMNVLAVKCPKTNIMYFLKKPYFPDQVSFIVNTSSMLSPVTSDGYINCAELVGSIIYNTATYKFYAHVADPDDGLHNLQIYRKYQTVIILSINNESGQVHFKWY